MILTMLDLPARGAPLRMTTQPGVRPSSMAYRLLARRPKLSEDLVGASGPIAVIGVEDDRGHGAVAGSQQVTVLLLPEIPIGLFEGFRVAGLPA